MSPTAGLDSLFIELGVEEDNRQCSNCSMFFKDNQTEEQVTTGSGFVVMVVLLQLPQVYCEQSFHQ